MVFNKNIFFKALYELKEKIENLKNQNDKLTKEKNHTDTQYQSNVSF